MASQTRDQQPPQEPEDLQVDTSGPDTGPPGADAGVADSERAHRLLTRVLRVTYPHDSLPDGPYERTASAVQQAAAEDAADDRALTLGLEGLERAAGGDFLSLDDEHAESLLRDRSDDHFFRRIRSTAVVALYDDAQVWEALGYEGSSFEQGGYLHRGFDDLDWLPAARVEESGEPRTEITPTAGEPA